MDGELPKSSSTSSLSGAGFVRLLTKVGDSIGKMTYTMVETDEVCHFADNYDVINRVQRQWASSALDCCLIGSLLQFRGLKRSQVKIEFGIYHTKVSCRLPLTQFP